MMRGGYGGNRNGGGYDNRNKYVDVDMRVRRDSLCLIEAFVLSHSRKYRVFRIGRGGVSLYL